MIYHVVGPILFYFYFCFWFNITSVLRVAFIVIWSTYSCIGFYHILWKCFYFKSSSFHILLVYSCILFFFWRFYLKYNVVLITAMLQILVGNYIVAHNHLKIHCTWLICNINATDRFILWSVMPPPIRCLIVLMNAFNYMISKDLLIKRECSPILYCNSWSLQPIL